MKKNSTPKVNPNSPPPDQKNPRVSEPPARKPNYPGFDEGVGSDGSRDVDNQGNKNRH